jgi:hypothetical protein
MGSQGFLWGKRSECLNDQTKFRCQEFLHTSSRRVFFLIKRMDFTVKCPWRIWNPHKFNSYQGPTQRLKRAQGEANLCISLKIIFRLSTEGTVSFWFTFSIMKIWDGFLSQKTGTLAQELRVQMGRFSVRGISRSLRGNTRVPSKFFVTVTIHEQFHKWVRLGTVFLITNQQFREVDSKGFWRWYITHRITGFLDFFHCPVFYKIENTTFQKLDLFPSSGKGDQLSRCLPPSPEDGNRSSFRNVVFSIF